MAQAFGADPAPASRRPLWEAPGLTVELAKDWGQVSVAVFKRDGGEGAWRNLRHRVILAPALIGPVDLSFDGGPTRSLTVEAGTVGFYPAGVEARGSQGPGQVVQVLLDPVLYSALMSEIGPVNPGFEPAANFADPLVAQIVRSLALEAGDGPADRLLVDGLSMALAVRISRRFASVREPEAPDVHGLSRERLARVLDHIEAHLGEELSLAELAKVACLSPFHFSRCFKRSVGVGPQRYVNRRRIERARELMRRTDEPLAAIAQTLGFADQSHFTQVFRRETGATPARFRAAVAA